VVEAESARIGALRLPAALWAAMRVAPRITVTAPRAARAAYLTRAYGDIVAEREVTLAAIEGLRALQPRALLDEWRGLADQGRHQELAAALMAAHYDPAYRRARLRHQGGPERLRLSVRALGQAELDRLADRMAQAVPKLFWARGD